MRWYKRDWFLASCISAFIFIFFTVVFIVAISVFYSCSVQPIAPPVVVPERPPAPVARPANLEASCPYPGVYQAVDSSEPVTQRFLSAMKYLGVKTIIRYGDYVNETIKGKTPKAPELTMIKDNGFDSLFVFQHNNSSIKSFTSARGEADAKRMKELYPNVPAFYFGADGEFAAASDQASVRTYFTAAAKATRALGKMVGVYGSGITCKNLMAAGLADRCWLANASRWTGTPEFTATGKWAMKQSLPKNCGGINVDFDQVNPAALGIGGMR